MERALAAGERAMNELSLDELDGLWEAAKARARAASGEDGGPRR